jgi:hypothetical protein
VLGEIAALHPRLPVVFAGNRKLANLWTERFFLAVAAGAAAPPLELPLDVTARYDASERGSRARARDGKGARSSG